MTADKLNCMLCQNPDCPGAQRFKNFGIGPAATGVGLGTIYKEVKTPVSYGLSQTYGTLDYYGPYGVFTPPPECRIDCPCPSSQEAQTVEETEKEILPPEGEGEGAGEGDCEPLRLTGGAGGDDVLQSASMMCKDLLVCFDRALVEYKEALRACIKLEETSPEESYVDVGSEPLRLTGGAGVEESGVPAPVMTCKDLMDSFDRVLVEYRRALGPCSKAECRFSENVTLESCKRVCKVDATIIEEVELSAQSGNISACGVSNCLFSRKPQTETDLYFQKKQYKAWCRSVACPFSRIKLEEQTPEESYVDAGSEPLRLTGGAGEEESGVPAPVMMCKDLLDSFDRVLVEYKRALGPCGKAECRFSENVTLESCKRVCKIDAAAIEEVELPAQSGNMSACGVSNCPFSRKPQTETDLYFQKKQYKAACGSVTCPFSKIKFGTANEDDLLELNMMNATSCGSPKCPSSIPQQTPVPLEPIHWDCPDPLPKGPCRNPMCPLKPPELRYKPTGPCGSSDCPWALPPNCGGADCPFPAPPACPPPQCPPPPCPPIGCPRPACPPPPCARPCSGPPQFCAGCGNPACPSTPRTCGDPYCPLNPPPLPCPAMTGGVCPPPPCPFQPCPFPGAEVVVAQQSSVCSNPACPFASSPSSPCGNPTCLFVDTPPPAAGANPDEVCSNPACPFVQKTSSPCFIPQCPFAKPHSLATSAAPCVNPSCPFAKPPMSSGGDCGNPACPYASKPSAPSSGGDVCRNPSCPYAKQKSQQEDGDICANPSCPYAKQKSQQENGDICANPSCPYAKPQAAKTCPNPQCPYAQQVQAQMVEDICQDPDCPLNKLLQPEGRGPVSQQDSFCNNPSCPFKGQGGLEPCSPDTCMAFGGPLECDACAQDRRKSSGVNRGRRGSGNISKKKSAMSSGTETGGNGGNGSSGNGDNSGGKRASKSAPAISKKSKAKKAKDATLSDSVIPTKPQTRDASAAAKAKAMFSYKMGDLYPGTNIGHRECVVPGRNVPAKMGWLWNVHVPCVGLQPRVGWRPGALCKSIARRILMHRKAQGLKMLPPFRDKKAAKGKKGKGKGKSGGGYGEYESDSDETVAPKPTLQVKKREGAYYITVNPLKDPKTLEDNENPYMDCTPMQFKIVKNKKEDENRTCFCGEDDEESSDSELDIEFTPPAGIIRPDRLKRKKNVAHTDTQYNPDDFSPPKEKGKAGKAAGGGGGGKGKKK